MVIRWYAMTGRPSDFTQDLADAICAELADGKSLRTVCDMVGMPCRQSVFRWLRTHEGFCGQYARAKQESADAMVDDMLAIADDKTSDHNDRRIRTDTRKWIASKLKPKAYGDRVALSGAEDGAPIVVTWATGEGV